MHPILSTIPYHMHTNKDQPFYDVHANPHANPKLGYKAGKYKRPLCVFLMDQKKTAGIGNYVLSEALYR